MAVNITIVAFWAHKLFEPDEPGQFGGAEVQLRLLSLWWIRHRGARVRFITRGQGPYRRFEQDGIEVIKLPYRSSRLTRALLGLWDLYRACVSDQSDVYIQRGGGVETGIVGLAAQRLKRPFLFMLSHIWDVNRVHERERGQVYGRLYMAGLKRASLIVAQTEDQQKLLKENYGRESVVLRSAHHIPEQPAIPERKALWVSRCDDWKHPHVFLDLAESLPDIGFTMLCPLIQPFGSRLELFEEIQTRAAGLPNVSFIPGAPFDETEALFESHRVFVNTSENEGFPNTYVQAMKWGRPIAALHVNPDGLLDRHHVGLFAAHDAGQLAEQVKRLMNNDGEWSRLSANARDYARIHHDIDMVAGTLFGMIEELTGSR